MIVFTGNHLSEKLNKWTQESLSWTPESRNSQDGTPNVLTSGHDEDKLCPTNQNESTLMEQNKTVQSDWLLIDRKTGEQLDVDILETDPRRWDKAWGRQIANMLDAGGDDRARVIATLFRRKDSMNYVHLTVGEIAEKSGVSTKTVSRTLKALEDKKFIVRLRQGRLMISPHVICRGEQAKGMAVITLWKKETIND